MREAKKRVIQDAVMFMQGYHESSSRGLMQLMQGKQH
jgi:hypothetical protein